MKCSRSLLITAALAGRSFTSCTDRTTWYGLNALRLQLGPETWAANDGHQGGGGELGGLGSRIGQLTGNLISKEMFLPSYRCNVVRSRTKNEGNGAKKIRCWSTPLPVVTRRLSLPSTGNIWNDVDNVQRCTSATEDYILYFFNCYLRGENTFGPRCHF